MAIEDIYASLGLSPQATSSNDISNFNNTVLASDSWNIAAKALGGTNFDMRTWSPTTQGVVSFGKNFLAGILGQSARNNAADQLASVASIFPQLQNDPANTIAPEGVDPNAFETLRLSQSEKKQSADSSIRQALANAGIAFDPATQTVSKIQGKDGGADLQTLLADLAGAKAEEQSKNKIASAIGQKSTVAVAKDLSGTIAAIDALNRASDKVSKFPGGSGTVGGVLNYLDKFVPNSAPYQYNKDLPLLNDPLTVGLSGTSKQGTLNQMKAALTSDFGQSTDSQLATLNEAKVAMADKVTKYIETLKAAGWPETDAPAGYPSLSEIREKFEKVGRGEALTDNPFLQPPTAAKSYKASDLIAQGYTKGANGWIPPGGQ